MDPLTALGVATTAFNTIKKGFAIGKDVEYMMKDVGRWMSAIDDVKNSHEKQKKIGSVEEEALETFGAIKKAKAMEEELRNFLIATYGLDAWNDLLRIQAKIRKQRKEEAEKKRRQQEEIIKIIFVFLGIIIFGSLLAWLVLKNI